MFGTVPQLEKSGQMGGEGPIQGGSISGVASQMYIVMLLYSELFRRMETRAQENKIKAAHAIAERKL